MRIMAESARAKKESDTGVFESGGEGEHTTMIESLQNKELWEKYCDEPTSKEWNTEVKIKTSEKR